jgi:hypothetical protein
MPPLADRSPRRLLAHGVLAALLGLAALVAYLTLAPSWRPVGMRVACTVLVIAGCLRVRRAVRQRLELEGGSILEAPRHAEPEPELDARFLRARDDLVASARSARYFESVLWPRLQAVAGGSLTPPAEPRRGRRRGPSLRTLDRLVAEAEKHA